MDEYDYVFEDGGADGGNGDDNGDDGNADNAAAQNGDDDALTADAINNASDKRHKNAALKEFVEKQRAEKALGSNKVKFGEVVERPLEISEKLAKKLEGRMTGKKENKYKFMSMLG